MHSEIVGFGSAIAVFCVISVGYLHAQEPVEAPLPPISGNLEMPLVSPEQAAEYLGQRSVPKSDMFELRPAARGPAIYKLDVAPVLGHDLPVENTTPAGFPRADFATADPARAEERRKKIQDALAKGGPLKEPARGKGAALVPMPGLASPR